MTRAARPGELRRALTSEGVTSSGDGEGDGGGGNDQDGDSGREHGDAGGEPAHEPIAAGPEGSPPRRQGRHRWSWLDRHRVALLDASARETPTTHYGSPEPSVFLPTPRRSPGTRP